MATIEKTVGYEAPGLMGSPVELKPRYENFIGGHWVAPIEGRYAENISPVTGKPFTEVPLSTPDDVELALDAAHAAKDDWAATSLAWRSLRAGRTESRSVRRSPPTSRSPSTTSATSPR